MHLRARASSRAARWPRPVAEPAASPSTPRSWRASARGRAGAARGDEHGVVAGQRPQDLGEAGLVERAGDGRGGADLGADDDQRAVAVDAGDEAAHRLERERAVVAVDRRSAGRRRRRRGRTPSSAMSRDSVACDARMPRAPSRRRSSAWVVDRPARQDLADRVAATVCVGCQVTTLGLLGFAARGPSEGPRGYHRRAQVTNVPTPRSVNSSATMLWGARPSTMCTARTPLASACSTAWALTCIPPLMLLPRRASRSAARISRDQAPVLVEQARDVGEEDEPLGAAGGGDLAGGDVGVDVVAGAVAPKPTGEMTGMYPCSRNMSSSSALTASISPTKPRSGFPGSGSSLCADEQPAVLARQADRVAAQAVDEPDDLGVDPPGQHHLDDPDLLGARDALAVGELGLAPHLLERLRDLGPAAVDDHRLQPGRLQQHDLLGEAALERRIDHRRAAVLDDRALAARTCGCSTAPRRAAGG